MADLKAHGDFTELSAARGERAKVNLRRAPAAIGAVDYISTAEVEAECALVAESPFADTFMTSASPGIVAAAMENQYYGSMDEYVRAVAAALSQEYHSIAEHGLLLQIDGPDLALERHTSFAGRPLGDFIAWMELVIGCLNHALTGIDRERIRLHVCWGNYEGPHTFDVALDDTCRPSTRQTLAAWCSRWPTPATPMSSSVSPAAPCPTT
jgi:5-methyltetrahydropteroyltriglutamate--homocysteine methyltransferase